MLLELQKKARAVALELADTPSAQLVAQLERTRLQAGVQEAIVLAGNGRLLASAAEDTTKLVPELPAASLLRQARLQRGMTSIDAVTGGSLALRAIVPMEPLALASEPRFLQLRARVPPNLARNAEAVEAAYRDYRELALSRDGLKRIYVVTLSFALLMALFVAVAVAVTQSRLLAEPLATLAQAIYYRVAGSSEPTSYTWTLSPAESGAGGIAAYRGVNNSSPIDTSSGAASTSNGCALRPVQITWTRSGRAASAATTFSGSSI